MSTKKNQHISIFKNNSTLLNLINGRQLKLVTNCICTDLETRII